MKLVPNLASVHARQMLFSAQCVAHSVVAAILLREWFALMYLSLPCIAGYRFDYGCRMYSNQKR